MRAALHHALGAAGPAIHTELLQTSRSLALADSQEWLFATATNGNVTTLADVADVLWFFTAFANIALNGRALTASLGWFME